MSDNKPFWIIGKRGSILSSEIGTVFYHVTDPIHTGRAEPYIRFDKKNGGVFLFVQGDYSEEATEEAYNRIMSALVMGVVCNWDNEDLIRHGLTMTMLGLK